MVNGLFAHMNYDFRAEVTKPSLDIMFLSNYGKKNPSPVVEVVLDDSDEKMTEPQLNLLAQLILETYKMKWDKLGEIYDIEYDPIHNYLDEWADGSIQNTKFDGSTHKAEETEYGKVDTLESTRTDDLTEDSTLTHGTTNTRTDNLTELETRALQKTGQRTDNLTETDTYGRTETRTDNLSEEVASTTTSQGTNSGSDGIYGFNSSTAVGKDTDSGSNSNTETVAGSTHNTGTQATAMGGSDSKSNTGTQSTTESDGGTVTTANTGTSQNSTTGTEQNVTENTGTRQLDQTDTLSGSDNTTTSIGVDNTEHVARDRSGRHFGNIGNLTSQKQILEEINLWRWNYVNEILNDVKEFCCLPVYLNGYR